MNELGLRIRQLRQEQRLTLEDLARRSGLSRSFLSEAERGHSSLTVTSLQRISEALNVPVAEFFQQPSAETVGPRIVRANGGTKFRVETLENTEYSSLAANFPDKQLEPVLTTILPYSTRRALPYAHPGEEFGFVLEGTLTILVGKKTYDLEPGDSIHLPSTIPHNFENRTDKIVRALWVSTPRLF